MAISTPQCSDSILLPLCKCILTCGRLFGWYALINYCGCGDANCQKPYAEGMAHLLQRCTIPASPKPKAAIIILRRLSFESLQATLMSFFWHACRANFSHAVFALRSETPSQVYALSRTTNTIVEGKSTPQPHKPSRLEDDDAVLTPPLFTWCLVHSRQVIRHPCMN